MRYLGGKEKLTKDIINLLVDASIFDEGFVFFDAFCGMGAVSNAVKDKYELIINDTLNCCTTYTKARLLAGYCTFGKLGFDPIVYLNRSKETIHGFFYKTYSPGGSERKYFTAENAAKIDYFRFQIEDWSLQGLISDDERTYLFGCLLDAVSSVSNTAGVYGAFLKHWDARAQKRIQLKPIGNDPTLFGRGYGGVTVFNSRLEDLISQVNCDILYLDPPYTQNQYGTQYHLLETLILNDNPPVSKITGSRPTAPMRSEWSKEGRPEILLDRVVAETKARYILMSYSSDGLLSKEYIESVFKRYGEEKTYRQKEIFYSEYRNYKTRPGAKLSEYLFFIEKKDRKTIVIESPLNYTGSKAAMVPEIKKLLPDGTKVFIDAFGGGFNVGINVEAEKIIYNDLNKYVVQLVESFSAMDTYSYLEFIDNISAKFGLASANKEGYLQLRKRYNEIAESERDVRLLYVLVLYGFQQQIRFNGAHEFNNPFGCRKFNDRLRSKFISFARASREKDIQYISRDYREIKSLVGEDTFVYLDPPYLNTTGVYNDGKRGFEGWSKAKESELLCFIDELDDRGCKFMLSYIFDRTSMCEGRVEAWAKRSHYRLIKVKDKQGRYKNRQEVLIINY